MPTCVKCQKEVGFVSSLLSFNKTTQRCGSCDKPIQAELNKFRYTFINVFQDNFFSQEKINYLFSLCNQSGLDWNEAITFVQSDSLKLLERFLTFISSDGIINQSEERHFYWVANNFQLPPNLTKPLVDRLQYLKYISSIRQGFLPTLKASTHLESDEICHLEILATYHKVNLRSTRQIQGRFIVTNKKLHFLSSDGGWTILWKNVMRVQTESAGVYLELAVKNGNGFYSVPDPVLTEATITTVTKMSKRQLLSPQAESQNRHIPQDVKTAVWQRDQGKCVQCGATSYLEFDHIIPFSKGGANTVNNLQLLCRSCNLKKKNRI